MSGNDGRWPCPQGAGARTGRWVRARSRLGGVWALLVAPLLMGGCEASLTEGADYTNPQEVEFDPSLGVDLSEMTRTESGLYLQDVLVGDGRTAELGQTIGVRFQGWLPDGTLFDQRLEDPIFLFLDVGQVIDGWVDGVPGMREGGERLLVVPPQLGYGFRPRNGIPGNSVLVFRIWLDEVEGDVEEEL